MKRYNRKRLLFICILWVLISSSQQQADDTLYYMFEGCQQAGLNQQTNTWQCNQCSYYYNFIDPVTCSIKDKTCQLNFPTCPLKHCEKGQIKSGEYQCLYCSLPYNSIDYKCSYYCDGQRKENMSDCLCQVRGCSECELNQPTICKTCDPATPLKVASRCFAVCPPGTFTNEYGTCSNCPQGCSRCTSASDCQECQFKTQFQAPPLCACPNNEFMINGFCKKECPFTTFPIASRGYCEQICVTGFPEYNQDGSIKDCQYQQTDEICSYSAQHIQKNLHIKTNQKDDYIEFTVYFIQTPICFQTSLSGGDTQFVLISGGSSSHLTSYIFKLPIEQNGKVRGCSSTQCVFILKVYWGQKLLYNFKVITPAKLSSISVTNIQQFNDSPSEQIEVVCTDCIIPISQIEPSTLTLICSEGQTCDDTGITASPGSTISFTQKVSNLDFKDSTLIPHSLRIDQYDETTNQVVHSITLKQYTFNNEIKGQITYSFTAIIMSRGSLIVTSYIKEQNLRFLASSNEDLSKVKYPQMHIELKIKEGWSSEEINNEDSGISPLTVGLIAGGCCLVLGIAAGIYIKSLKKKNSQTSEQIQIPYNPKYSVKIDQPIVLQEVEKIQSNPHQTPENVKQTSEPIIACIQFSDDDD